MDQSLRKAQLEGSIFSIKAAIKAKAFELEGLKNQLSGFQNQVKACNKLQNLAATPISNLLFLPVPPAVTAEARTLEIEDRELAVSKLPQFPEGAFPSDPAAGSSKDNIIPSESCPTHEQLVEKRTPGYKTRVQRLQEQEQLDREETGKGVRARRQRRIPVKKGN
ncbi:unnamed protein product [Amoebophrya sp. A25]|nr:unnamed protein product [Amoebophrya sp. A25]|eukprot:GSA25T00027076001.1